MPVVINDSISIGALTFAINPESYSIKTAPVKNQRRTRTGKIIETGVKTGADWKLVREFTIEGWTEEQYATITNLFKSASVQTFVDPLSNSYQVFLKPEGVEWSQTGADPYRPRYTINLIEVG